METDGGDWTLVWSYTFTDYNHFTAHSNAITPTPNWQVRYEVNVPVSTTASLNETDVGRSERGVLGCPWPPLCKPLLSKQPTIFRGENAMTIMFDTV